MSEYDFSLIPIRETKLLVHSLHAIILLKICVTKLRSLNFRIIENMQWCLK